MKNPEPSPPGSDSFWQALFNADSIAVIGAKETPGTWGFDAMRAMVESARAKPGRRVYAVNPGIREVLGVKAYASILDIPDPVDLAVIVVPAAVVPDIFRQCVRKKVRAAAVISAGFSEVGGEGVKLEDELREITRKSGMRFVGPNCIGHADIHSRLASAAVAGMARPGPVSLLSQSGTLGASIMQIATSKGIGLSKFVSTGNEASLRMEDYLEYLAGDDSTRVIAAYIEGLREARRFFRLTREITREKPIVVMKSGATGEAARAARSHTGALSGSDQVYSAAFRQAGVIRAEDEEELCDILLGLLRQPLPCGNGVAILTMGGGFGVVTAEICEKEGLNITPLEPETLKKLDTVLPPRWSHGNPVDLVGIRPTGADDTINSCMRFLMEDANVDAVISLLPPMVTTHGPIGNLDAKQLKEMQEQSRKNLEVLNRQIAEYKKPVVFIRRFGPVAPEVAEKLGINMDRMAEYSHPRRAARVLSSLAWYRRYLDSRKP